MTLELKKLRAPKIGALLKIAGGIESLAGGLASKLAPVLLPAGLGAYAAGPEHRMEGAIGGAALGALGKRLAPKLLRKAMFTNPKSLEMSRQLTGSGVSEGSRAYKRIQDALGDETPAFIKSLTSFKEHTPAAIWGGRALGGAGGGLAVKELFGNQTASHAPYINAQPAVSDMSSQYYSGLVPDASMYY